jgi:fucose permease
MLLFLISGASIGTWTARIPTIKGNLHLGDGQLSLALAALAAGGLAGMKLSGRFVDRYGSTAVLTPAALLLGPALILPAYATGLIELALVLLAFGLCHGCLNTAMNVHGVHCQRAYQRPIMTLFHALFSIGGFAGAAVGGLFARASRDADTTFIVVGTAVLALALCAVRLARSAVLDRQPAVDPGTDGREVNPTERRPFPVRRATILGLLAFAALINEGAAADWSSVFLYDTLGSSTALAAAAYAAFALAMTTGRLFGDRLIAAAGTVAVLRTCGLLAAAGVATAVAAGHPLAAVAGFAALGAGLSCVVPQLYSAAGALDPAQPGQGVSVVAAIGYVGYLGGPVVIGALAERIGLGHALLILPPMTVAIAVAATAVRSPRHTGAASASTS